MKYKPLNCFFLAIPILYVVLYRHVPVQPCEDLKQLVIRAQSDDSKHLPTLLHFEWPANVPLGPVQQRTVDAYQHIFPNHSVVWWNDTDIDTLIEKQFPWFLPVYQGFPHRIQKVDAARYFILYRYGGLYSDLDYEPLANFWPLLSSKRVTLPESPHIHASEVVQNSLMASVPHHPFWVRCRPTTPTNRLIRNGCLWPWPNKTGRTTMSCPWPLPRSRISCESCPVPCL